MQLARWVDVRADRITDRWLIEVRARGAEWDDSTEALMRRFFALLVSLLPPTLGPHRELAEGLWVRTAELFGSVSAKRGLAAGEVIEEFQLLRDGLIRFLFEEPLAEPSDRTFIRDLLRLNRVIDRGVTQASVGHTDALFFALFGPSGISEPLSEPLIAEIHDQMDAVGEELADFTAPR